MLGLYTPRGYLSMRRAGGEPRRAGGEPPRAVARRTSPKRRGAPPCRAEKRGIQSRARRRSAVRGTGEAARRREPGGPAAKHRALPQRDRGYMRGRRTSTGVSPRAPSSGTVRQRALLPCRTATPHAWCTRRQGLGRRKGAIDGTPTIEARAGKSECFQWLPKAFDQNMFFRLIDDQLPAFLVCVL